MEEVMRVKIKSIYAELKGFQRANSFSSGAYVNKILVYEFNSLIGRLSAETGSDYDSLCIPPDAHIEYTDEEEYDAEIAISKLERVLSRLETEYGFGGDFREDKLPIVVNIANENNQKTIISSYSILDLIDKSSNIEETAKLEELDAELSRQEKDWGKIKGLLRWFLDFGKDTFLQLLPIIIERYGK